MTVSAIDAQRASSMMVGFTKGRRQSSEAASSMSCTAPARRRDAYGLSLIAG